MNEIKEKAKLDYRLGMSYKDIAAKYNISVNTLKKWIQREGWERKKFVPNVPEKCTQKGYKDKDSEKLKNELFDSLDSSELTEKQKLFCLYYVECFNARQAYLKAYGGENDSASSMAYRLLNDEKIQAEIMRLRETMRSHYNFELADYIKKLLKIVGADIGDFVKFGRREEVVVGLRGVAIDKRTGEPAKRMVNYIDLAESANVDTSTIAEIRQVKGDVSVKLEDKTFALKELAKIFGFDELEYKRRELENKKLEVEIKYKGNFAENAIPIVLVDDLRSEKDVEE